MSFMRPIFALTSTFLAMSLLFACAKGFTGGGGGGGAGADDEWGSGSTSSGPKNDAGPDSGTGGSGGGATGAGGGLVTFCDINNPDCPSCLECSRNTSDGQCQSVYSNCINTPACTKYSSCASACTGSDPAPCLAACDANSPGGKAVFDTYAQCVICNDCLARCYDPAVCG